MINETFPLVLYHFGIFLGVCGAIFMISKPSRLAIPPKNNWHRNVQVRFADPNDLPALERLEETSKNWEGGVTPKNLENQLRDPHKRRGTIWNYT